MGRDLDGAETYRISELAELAGVTKRTVDYYTNLGLLKPDRSCSNYRYYDTLALNRLKFIVACKSSDLLSDIKDRLENQFPSSALPDDIGNLASEIDHMNQNISVILNRFEKLEPEERAQLKKAGSRKACSASIIYAAVKLNHYLTNRRCYLHLPKRSEGSNWTL